ncbi:hypothetical protein STSO111631_20225 [Stackebrandtia soli]
MMGSRIDIIAGESKLGAFLIFGELLAVTTSRSDRAIRVVLDVFPEPREVCEITRRTDDIARSRFHEDWDGDRHALWRYLVVAEATRLVDVFLRGPIPGELVKWADTFAAPEAVGP